MISLGVRDLEESVRFYEQGLGLPRMNSPPEVAFVALDGTCLGLYGRQSLADDAGVPADGTGFAGVAIAHNVDSEGAVVGGRGSLSPNRCFFDAPAKATLARPILGGRYWPRCRRIRQRYRAPDEPE